MPTLNVPLRNYILNGMADAFDGGKLRIYSGTKPAAANLAPTGTLLAEIDLPEEAFAPDGDGVIAKQGTWQDTSANGTGTAGWARLSEDGDDDSEDGDFHRMDLTVTATGMGGEIELDNTSIAAGQQVTVTAFTITQPAGT